MHFSTDLLLCLGCLDGYWRDGCVRMAIVELHIHIQNQSGESKDFLLNVKTGIIAYSPMVCSLHLLQCGNEIWYNRMGFITFCYYQLDGFYYHIHTTLVLKSHRSLWNYKRIFPSHNCSFCPSRVPRLLSRRSSNLAEIAFYRYFPRILLYKPWFWRQRCYRMLGPVSFYTYTVWNTIFLEVFTVSKQNLHDIEQEVAHS